MKALIFNSGLGSRMGELTKDRTKSMVTLKSGEMIFERQLRLLTECGIKDVIVTTGPFKEKIQEIASHYPLNFTFVSNPKYKETNYIYSMYLASQFLDSDILLMHGDLVFNRELLEKMIAGNLESLCVYHPTKKLPEKDFKGRICNGYLQEISIHIFDKDCYAFQPLYYLKKEDMEAWLKQIKKFVAEGTIGVYAENALNEILDSIAIKAISYADDYIDEVDTKDDLNRVSDEIMAFEKRMIGK